MFVSEALSLFFPFLCLCCYPHAFFGSLFLFFLCLCLCRVFFDFPFLLCMWLSFSFAFSFSAVFALVSELLFRFFICLCFSPEPLFSLFLFPCVYSSSIFSSSIPFSSCVCVCVCASIFSLFSPSCVCVCVLTLLSVLPFSPDFFVCLKRTKGA